jgi:hypothetical protein
MSVAVLEIVPANRPIFVCDLSSQVCELPAAASGVDGRNRVDILRLRMAVRL